MKEPNAGPKLRVTDAPEHEDAIVEFLAIRRRQIKFVVHVIEKHITPVLKDIEVALESTHQYVGDVQHHRTLVGALEQHTERGLL
eukprot:6997937-Prymnesium_polylepis.1